MPRLPPVDISFQILLRRICSFTSAYSARTLLHSQPSSSATNCAKPVKVPWPSSERAIRIVTVSSGAITTQCVTSAASAATAFVPCMPSTNTPLSAAECFKKVRRDGRVGTRLMVWLRWEYFWFLILKQTKIFIVTLAESEYRFMTR